MKCIYCKVTKTFVCKTHNSFTTDMYEKKFVADLNFFRNQLVVFLHVTGKQFSI